MNKNKQLNKRIFNLNHEYKSMIRKIICNTLKEYNGIPIDWEDIYWEFLFHFVKQAKDFDVEVGIKQHTYIGIQAKNFAKNKCRHFSRQRHRVMNNYVTLNDYDKHLKVSDVEEPIKTKIDLSKLDRFEVRVFQFIFIEGRSLRKTEQELGKSRYYISMSIQKIKEKLYLQMEKLV